MTHKWHGLGGNDMKKVCLRCFRAKSYMGNDELNFCDGVDKRPIDEIPYWKLEKTLNETSI